MKFWNSKFCKPVLSALLFSLGLQGLVILLPKLPLEHLSNNFRFVLSLVWDLILTPYMLTGIAASNLRISTNAIETLAWAAQFVFYFILFFGIILMFAKRKNE